MFTALFVFPSLASEYEVDGTVTQKITQGNTPILHASASFTVYVRDCSWMIESVETNELGGIIRREIGSTNGATIYECEFPLGRVRPPGDTTEDKGDSWIIKRSQPLFGTIISSDMPVGATDSAVVGHLWLMFASQCYWPSQMADQLVPVYNWQASVAAGGRNMKVQAGWSLLNGPGSLPQTVWYMGEWGETNALYSIIGTNLINGTLIPTGFTFEQFAVGPLPENSFVHEMVVTKRVDVRVTAMRPVCSRASLIPTPGDSTMITDLRFSSGIPNRPPSYRSPVNGKWLSIDESKVLASVQRTNDLRNLDRARKWGLIPTNSLE